MTNAIEIKKLSKSYGEIEAVKNVSLSVNKGEMFGIVGPDGAGKTTTIRILCGLLSPDSGSVTFFGKELAKNKASVKKEIGYLSQKFSLYADLTIDENIEFFADIHGVKNHKERRNELLEFTRLTPFRNRLAGKLSGGMKQKLALACTLIHKPKIIFLDEPTTGVDPVSRRDFWKILAGLLKEEITIFMSTPYLDEAERCNHIALMNRGEIISFNTPQAIKAGMSKDFIEVVCEPIREAYILLKEKNYEAQMFGDRINIVVESSSESAGIKHFLEKNSIKVSGIREIPPSLENIFIHLIKETS